MVVGGRDVFVIQQKGRKSLNFQSAPIFFDIVRLKCAKSIVLVISPLVSLYVRPCSLYKISRDKCRDHWRRTKLRTGQKTCRKKICLLKSTSPQLLLSQCE